MAGHVKGVTGAGHNDWGRANERTYECIRAYAQCVRQTSEGSGLYGLRSVCWAAMRS